MGTCHGGWHEEDAGAQRFPSRKVALTTGGERRTSEARRSPRGVAVFVLELTTNECRAGCGGTRSVGALHKLGERRSRRGLWGWKGVMCLFFYPKSEYASRAVFNSEPGSNSAGIPDRVSARDGANSVTLTLR